MVFHFVSTPLSYVNAQVRSMQSPGSFKKRTCPACKRPVEPGFKFCETCGTHVPELITCGRCGTQFIDPGKYCDLCGATIIRSDAAEPSDSPEDTGEDETGPAEDPVSEPGEEEIPEPSDSPEDSGKDESGPAADDTAHHPAGNIPEPRTDELLEQYGREYGEDETIGSRRTPKPGTFDDALFFPKKSQRHRLNPG
jgi:predicted nucleic acid-binding Zn ribbon protein